MSTFVQVPIANGATVIKLQPQTSGNIEISLFAPSPPTGGTLTIDGLPYGSASYVRIGGATNIALSTLLAGGVIQATDFGHYSALRFTLAGVTGGSGSIYGTVTPSVTTSTPDGAATGLRALTTQTYNETNAKLGTQFFFQTQFPSMPGNSTYAIAFATGALPVLVKDRQMTAYAVSVTLQLFKQPTYTGGTPIVVQNYNDIAPNVTTVTATKGVTVTSNGTVWGDAVRLFGAATTANRTSSGLAPGGDRVLKPNSSYLILVTNTDTNTTATVDYFLTWYEGLPDLPRA